MTTHPGALSLSTFEPLGPAEDAVLRASRAGVVATLGDIVPAAAAADVTVRADFLRWLCQSPPEAAVHIKGVRLSGAWIDGRLDIDYCDLRGALQLKNCRIAGGVSAASATVGALSLAGSHVADVAMANAVVGGDVRVSGGFRADGAVVLTAARIGGRLECGGGRFDAQSATALDAQSIQVAGDVLLGGGLHAAGPVDFGGASLGGVLDCAGAAFGAAKGEAFSARNMNVAEIFYWRNVSVPSGAVLLTQARVGALADDLDSWPGEGRLMMDGFVYDRIVYGDTSAKRRLTWLDKHASNEFQPQPHQQLAAVIGDMGHRFDRGRVLIDMERRLRRQTRADMARGGRSFPEPVRRMRNLIRIGLHRVWDAALYGLVGYGYRPWWALVWGVAMIAIVWAASAAVWTAGGLAPDAGPVLVSAAWQALAQDPSIANPAAAWTAPGAPGQDYETFRPWIYAVDVVVPLVNLGQDAAWSPSTVRGPVGLIWHHLEWLFRLFGWVVAALGAGAVAGGIRND